MDYEIHNAWNQHYWTRVGFCGSHISKMHYLFKNVFSPISDYPLASSIKMSKWVSLGMIFWHSWRKVELHACTGVHVYISQTSKFINSYKKSSSPILANQQTKCMIILGRKVSTETSPRILELGWGWMCYIVVFVDEDENGYNVILMPCTSLILRIKCQASIIGSCVND